MKPKAFFTLAELARLSGVSRWRVRRLLEANGVTLERSGRLIVVSLAALKRGLPDVWEGVIVRNLLQASSRP